MAALTGTYVDLQGEAVQLHRRLAIGRDAEFFSLAEDDSRVAKIYNLPASAREQKFRAMIENSPPDATLYCRHSFICWPEALIHGGDGGFAGFVMPRINFAVHRPLLFFCDLDSRERNSAHIDWPFVIRIGINLCGVFEAIHSQGHVVGDINDSNLLVSDSGRVTLIDCDSIQVHDHATGLRYRCPLGNPEFTAPELQGAAGEVERDATHDHFALGVAIFMLLMEGIHPFEGLWQGGGAPPTLEENIKEGRFPYANSKPLNPSPAAPPFDILPPVIRSLFERCFVEGHEAPAKRPSAWDWHHALKQMDHQLESCNSNRRHLYSNHLSRCPWCRRNRALGKSNPAGAEVANQMTTRSKGASGVKASRSVFSLNFRDFLVGRKVNPGRTSFGADLFLALVIGLLAAAGTLYWLVGLPDGRYFTVSAPDRLFSSLLEKFGASESNAAGSSPQLRMPGTSGEAQFDRLILCRAMDKTQNPVGEAATFREGVGLAAYVQYSSSVSHQTEVQIKWSSTGYSGSSSQYALPRSGPFFARLGNKFPPGSYHFSLVVDGVAKRSAEITIYPR